MRYDLAGAQQDLPPKGKVIVYWLAGAGFLFRFDDGLTFCVDPYLSDAVERLYGFKRSMPAPVSPDGLHFDILFLTHQHEDHLDIDSFDKLMKANPHCEIIASEPCAEFLRGKGAAFTQVAAGDSVERGSIRIDVIRSAHGEQCPLAVGFLLHVASRRVYFSGDSAYDDEIVRTAAAAKPDIVIPCINGAFGNMSEAEAAACVAACGAAVAIPSHYALFAEHGGDAAVFAEHVARLSPATRVHALGPGEGVEIP